MRISKLWLFIMISFIAGFVWGRVSTADLPQRYPETRIAIGGDEQMVSLDILRDKDNIRIIDQETGQLIFEYNRYKETDRGAFREFEAVLIEIMDGDG
ncbi:MAG: hypothetical protein AABZ65_04150 [Candidatus Omnitrophota bacterium]